MDYQASIDKLFENRPTTIEEATFEEVTFEELLMNALKNAPLEYRSCLISFVFNPEDDQGLNLLQKRLMTNLGINPKQVNGETVYEFPVLLPRDPVVDSPIAHGSLHREAYFAQGIIETIEINNNRHDHPENMESYVFQINPVKIGALSLERRFGIGFFFQRHIKRILLSSDVPSYLSQLEQKFVNEFYARRSNITNITQSNH